MKKRLSPVKLSLSATAAVAVCAAPAYATHSRHKLPTHAAQPNLITVHITGHVAAQDQRPVKGSRLYLSWISQDGSQLFKRLVLKADGSFDQTAKFERKQTMWVDVSAISPENTVAMRTFPVTSTVETNITLRLPAPVTITGRLLRVSGLPAANVPMHLSEMKYALTAADASIPTHYDSFLPAAELRKLFHTTTDGDGRFTMTGFSPMTQVVLAPDQPLDLAPGSAAPHIVASRPRQDIGLLVAEQLGGVIVRVSDSATGKPAAGVPVTIAPANPIDFMIGIQSAMGRGGFAPQPTNASGELKLTRLRPGEYRVAAEGSLRPVLVKEGRIAEPVAFSLRQGPLAGVVTDAHGKPVSGATITANFTPFVTFIAQAQMAMSAAQHTGWEIAPLTTTDAAGRYSIDSPPWGTSAITIRATRGNDRTEWTGSPSAIGSSLAMRLQPNALMNVTGRLLDPQRRPIANLAFQTLHWTSSERTVWLANARQGKSGPDGCFRLTGLERGESFSLILSSQLSGGDSKHDFELPRFLTTSSADTQDLGEIIVHPDQGDESIQQLYGMSDDDQVAIAGFIPAPSADDVSEARQALARYRSALRAGDLTTAQQLTSHLFAGWQSTREEYLRFNTLRIAPDAAAGEKADLRPASFVPRFSLSIIVSFMSGNVFFASSPGGPRKEMTDNPDWVYFMELCADGTATPQIMHRESGQWRLLPFPNAIIPRTMTNEMAKDWNNPVPATAGPSLAAAKDMGNQFLHLWADEKWAEIRPLSVFAEQNNSVRQVFAHRPDGGACPLAAADIVKLEEVTGLTKGERRNILQAAMLQNFGGFRASGNGFADIAGNDGENGLVIFRYSVDGRGMLMIVRNAAGKWKMIEPALPL